jgi:DNA replication licensing factor MCM4
MGGSEAI